MEIVMLLLAVTVNGTALASVSWTTNAKVPVAVGVPEICPVEALNDRPGGNDPLATTVTSGDVPPADVIMVE